ncbi:hypothetical protein EV652_110119 [Kribbella steppae]|uniref:Uncharacterized protein n=1 Tax=Kribbella steppae TaxID=2512223 RepID=A0A4R2H6Z2_9ACTN|nr:hypothetical protein [Kribbella steppae]TCO22134.1 hypothetical protein EV652_110119 [Kribbella steppae]
MAALDEARAHLAKAREFLEADELTNDLALYNAAATKGILITTSGFGPSSYRFATGKPLPHTRCHRVNRGKCRSGSIS